MRRWFRRLLPSLARVRPPGFRPRHGCGGRDQPTRGRQPDGRPSAPHLPGRHPGSPLRRKRAMTGVEAWSDDHVPSRPRWLNAHAGLSTRVMQDPLINDVYVGDDSGLQLEALSDYRVPAALGDNAQLLGQQVRAAGSQILFVYVPRKEEVFADRLPAGLRSSLPCDPGAGPRRVRPRRSGPGPDPVPVGRVPPGRLLLADRPPLDAGRALEALDQITVKARSMGFVIPPDTRPYAPATYPDFYGSTARRALPRTPRPDQLRDPHPTDVAGPGLLPWRLQPPDLRHADRRGPSTSTPTGMPRSSAATTATSRW